MGLFSSDKEVEVSVSVSRAIEDRLIPNTSRASTSEALVHNHGIPEALVDGWTSSIAMRADRMYAYARKWHAYGLPQSSLYSSLDGKGVLQQVLAEEHKAQVVIDYHHLAPFNALHRAWQILVDQYGYNSRTNQLDVLSQLHKTPVYLKDIVPVYCMDTIEQAAPGALNQWGLPANTGATPERPSITPTLAAHTPYEVDLQAEHDYVWVTYVMQSEFEESITPEITAKVLRYVEGTLPLDMSEWSRGREFFQVQYRVPSVSGAKRLYWSYTVGSQELPVVEAIQEDVFTGLGTYYPFTYFRYNFQGETSASNQYTDAYEDQKKMLNYLGMDYDQVGDAINANPGIENIVHALMMFGVPAGSQDPAEQKYLFEYFNVLFYAQGGKNPDFNQPFQPSISGKRISIHDRRFSMSFGYRSISKRPVGGSVAKVGAYQGGLEGQTYVYRFQRTAAVYDEIRVDGMLINFSVYNGYGFGGGPGSKIMLIPVDQALMERLTLAEREVVYSRSMHYIMCSYTETETKWYEKGWFKIVILIIAVAIAVFSMGGLSGISAALAAMTATAAAFAIAMLKLVIAVFVMPKVFSMVAKAVGPEFAMLLAVALIAYGGYQNFAGVEGSQAMWADAALSAGNGLMDAAGTQMQQEIIAMKDNMTAFNLMADSKWAELDEAKKLLGPANTLDPFEFIGKEPKIVLGETPNDFYTRTVHAGNIGTIGMDSLSSFVDISLKLPDLSTSAAGWDYS